MISASYTKKELLFKKPARTSRGEITTHQVYYIKLITTEKVGYGEAAPLKGLSIDDRSDFEEKIIASCQLINDGLPIDALDLKEFPSLQFAFETARLCLQYHEPFKLFDTNFYSGTPIHINGLVWMNAKDEMLTEAFEKAEQGFNCIKFKVGALDFDEECRLLELFRKRYSPFNIELRLDANGAFSVDDAQTKIKELSRFGIHSIEQPIKPKQSECMQELCAKTTIPVALDEELIGIDVITDGYNLLSFIKPQYIIIKPTLLGGLAVSDNWVQHAQKLEIDWWATSALESNIGLNAIAQWCAKYPLQLPQGLGTGSLYQNNISSPLVVSQGKIFYNPLKNWNLPK